MKKILTLAFVGIAVVFASCDLNHWKEEIGTTTVTGQESNYDYVDLGLPSGTKWATCNVGATKPEESGNYFAWGEIAPKEVYSLETYIFFQEDVFCKGETLCKDTLCKGDTLSGLSKYCTNKDWGYKTYEKGKLKDEYKDTLTILQDTNDIATIEWGGAWRLPTDEELTELRLQCTWASVTLNGEHGYSVTGPNGNSIFLPAAGYMDASEVIAAGEQGNYWSKSSWIFNQSKSWAIYFDADSKDHSHCDRYLGLTVRPVCR